MTRIRVLCYNMRAFRDDTPALIEVVRGVEPDVVFVQETPRFIRWRSRSAGLAAACGLVVVPGGGAPACGNMLMVRAAIAADQAHSMRFPHTIGEQPRGAAVAKLSLNGTHFTAAGVHLGHPRPERLRHAEYLLQELSGEDPLLVAGDFNEDFNAPAAKPLHDVLTATLRDAAGEDRHSTFSAKDPRRRIDGIFVDPRVDVVHYGVMHNDLTVRASDHLPIIADLRVLASGVV